MRSIKVSENKTLKLENVLVKKIVNMDEQTNLDLDIEKMRHYIQIRGMQTVGPIIQYTKSMVDENEELNAELKIMLQCTQFIHNVSEDYQMLPAIKVKNCLYCRYIGPQEDVRYAYDKMRVYAFEHEIDISDESYTIFAGKNEHTKDMIIDIFFPLL